MNIRQAIEELVTRTGVQIVVVKDVAEGWEESTATLTVTIGSDARNRVFEGKGITHFAARQRAFNQLERMILRERQPS